MTPKRRVTINGHKIEEYYWNGRMVVYVDDCSTDELYAEAVRRLSCI